MALLIDGYNLLHVTDIFGEAGPGTDLHRARLALLNFLAAAISKKERMHTAIVFDASGALPGLPRLIHHQGMTVHFAPRDSDADEMIEDLLEKHRSPKTLLVVSADHRVQRAARSRGAKYVDSLEWYTAKRAEMRAKNTKEKPCQASGNLTSEELAYWMQQFGEAPPVEEPDSIFPPGYGEDLEELH